MKKRILSFAIATLLLLLAMPIGGVVAWEAPTAGYTNTSELFNPELGTVYATKGTPTLGSGSMEEWKEAYSFTVRTLYRAGGTDDNGMDVKIGGTAYKLYYTYIVYYVMWDESNLYILENRPYDTIQYVENPAGNYNWANWSGGGIDMTCFRLVLPTEVDAENGKYGANNLVFVGTGVRETDAAETVKDSVVEGNVAKFDGSGTKQTKENYSDYLGKFSAVQSKTTRTAHGFYTETAIPWSVLDDFDQTDFVAESGKTMGIGLNINANNANCDDFAGASEVTNFRPLKLTEENPTAAYIEPDFSWYDDASGDKTEFVLEDEADLMGLNLLMSYGIEEKHAKISDSNNHLKELYPLCTQGHWGGRGNILLNGRTVKLAKDMDLNVGWLADGSGKALANEWAPIGLWSATFDGQGHSIRGISTIENLRYVAYHGFFSYLSAGSSVKNLTLENGTVETGIDNTTQTGGVTGGISGEGKTDGITISNVTCTLNVIGRNASEKTAGIVPVITGGAEGMIVTLENCEFGGTVANSANNSELVAAIAVDSDEANKTVGRFLNCRYTGTESVRLYRYMLKNTASFIGGNYCQTAVQEDGSLSLRLIGVLNGKNLTYTTDALEQVGYNVTAETAEGVSAVRKMRTGVVYGSVYAAGELVSASALGGDVLYALVINGIPANGTVTFTVTPIYTDASGNELQPFPAPITVTVTNGVLQ